MAAFFDAAAMMKELRGTFGSGKTRSVEWRRSQLKALLKLAEFHEGEILEALRSDLSKPELESLLQEVGPPTTILHFFLRLFHFFF